MKWLWAVYIIICVQFCLSYMLSFTSIKFFYLIAGCSINDDLIVIIGITKVGADSVVKEAIIKLLNQELGLEIVAGKPSLTVDGTIDKKGTSNSVLKSRSVLEKSEFPYSLDTPARRPAVLQRLLVTKKSLSHWLRKPDTATRC